MTTICAAVSCDGRSIVFGSDTQATLNDARVSPTQKWVMAHGWHIGIAGDSRAGSILARHAYDAFRNNERVFDFAETVRALLERFGWRPENDGGAPRYRLSGLIIRSYDGRFAPELWEFCGGFSLERVASGDFMACGSGAEFARGAAHALRDRSPSERVEAALTAAVDFDIWSGGPLNIETVT